MKDNRCLSMRSGSTWLSDRLAPCPTSVSYSSTAVALDIPRENQRVVLDKESRARVDVSDQGSRSSAKKIRNEKAVLRSTMMGHDDEIALESSHYTRCFTLVHSLGFFFPKKAFNRT